MRVWCVGAETGIGRATNSALINKGHWAIGSGKAACDVRSPDAIEEFIGIHGPFNAMVYSAGINKLRWIEDLTHGFMSDILSTNLVGFTNVLAGLKKFNDAPAMRVVAVTSDAATRPMRGSLAYCASKAALEMAVKVAARELGPFGWRINSVAPGMTEPTQMQKQLDKDIPEFRKWTPEEALTYELSANPLGRRAHTMEVADMIVSVLEMPDYVNGSTFTINGGR